jgi:hypothetical protein
MIGMKEVFAFTGAGESVLQLTEKKKTYETHFPIRHMYDCGFYLYTFIASAMGLDQLNLRWHY